MPLHILLQRIVKPSIHEVSQMVLDVWMLFEQPIYGLIYISLYLHYLKSHKVEICGKIFSMYECIIHNTYNETYRIGLKIMVVYFWSPM